MHVIVMARTTSSSLAVVIVVAVSGVLAFPAMAGAADRPLPRLVQKDGRHALLVDGAPFLMLGAQVGNSSAWPAMLPQVWPAIKAIHANTVEMPVYWEQLEPQPGKRPAPGKQREYLRVEEGAYDKGKFKPVRIWNGDQTDWALNFTSAPQVLRVSVGTY